MFTVVASCKMLTMDYIYIKEQCEHFAVFWMNYAQSAKLFPFSFLLNMRHFAIYLQIS